MGWLFFERDFLGEKGEVGESVTHCFGLLLG